MKDPVAEKILRVRQPWEDDYRDGGPGGIDVFMLCDAFELAFNELERQCELAHDLEETRIVYTINKIYKRLGLFG